MLRFNKNKTGFRCLQVLLTLAFASPSVQADDAFLTTSSSSRLLHTFPFEPWSGNIGRDNQPLVQVKINGSASATFLFDTGTNTTMISDKIAAQLKLKSQHLLFKGKTITLEGKPANMTKLASINLGGFEVQDLPVVIVPENRMTSGTKNIQGTLGIDMLKYYEYLFDFSKHTITMYSPARLVSPGDDAPEATPSKYVAEGLATDEIQALGFGDAKIIPIKDGNDDGWKYVHAVCANGGKQGEEDMVLDTGATATVISPGLASRLALKPFVENVPHSGFSGPEYTSTAPTERFQVGNLVLQDQQLNYSSQRAYDKNSPPLFGMNILSKYDVLMDFTANKLYSVGV